MRKLRPRGLHELVVNEIGSRIVNGEFKPGAPLPVEMHLCSELSVSRTALREGLRVLASKGLVEPRRKVGTHVRRVEDWNFLDADILGWQLQGPHAERTVAELYELRHLIEPLAASLAARNIQSDDLNALRGAYQRMVEAGDDGDKFAVPDLEFHVGILGASGNRLFSSFTHVIAAALQANFDLVRDAPRGHTQSVPEHKRVLDAIARRDPSAARLAMQQLIEASQKDAKAIRRAATRVTSTARQAAKINRK